MYLQDAVLRDLIEQHKLIVEPFTPAHVGPEGIDVTVGTTCYRWRSEPGQVVMHAPKTLGQIGAHDMVREAHAHGDLITVASLESVLLTTDEWVEVPSDLVMFVSNKSTTARSGLFVHLGAGHIDAGFKGRITLEVFNVAPFPIQIPVGIRIATILLARLMGPAERPYGSEGLGSRYQRQTDAQPALPERVYWEIPGRTP